MKMLRLIGRTARRMVWETAMDNTTGLAAQMAYQLLFTLAPGLLFLWHLLGLFGTDPAKLHRIFVVLKEFLPPDPKVQDILDSALASVVVTGSSGWIANAGIIAGIYLGTMFISTVSRALTAAARLEEEGFSVEVVDIRTIVPLDEETILASARKTGRVLVAHEAIMTVGFGGEIAARVADGAFDHLEILFRQLVAL